MIFSESNTIGSNFLFFGVGSNGFGANELVDLFLDGVFACFLLVCLAPVYLIPKDKRLNMKLSLLFNERTFVFIFRHCLFCAIGF